MAGFTDADVPDQSGRTFFISGANSGLGFEAATVLARQGGRVLLGCRNPTKAENARAAILAKQPDADLTIVAIDLSDLASVAQAAETVAAEPRLDALINNAGIMFPEHEVTADGFESQFGVNHLGAFALTAHLMPTLLKTDRSRVVAVSSNGHKPGNIYFDDIHAERKYNKFTRYFQSKLANLLFMYELDRRLRSAHQSTISVAAHPGGATTELSRHLPQLLVKMSKPFERFMNTAASGAWPLLMAATAPDVSGGQYFGPNSPGEMYGPAVIVGSTQQSKDPALALRLWDLSVKMTGLDPTPPMRRD